MVRKILESKFVYRKKMTQFINKLDVNGSNSQITGKVFINFKYEVKR